MKAIAAAVFIAVAAFIAQGGLEVGLALIAALALAGMVLRDLVLRVRLAADTAGIRVVSGLTRHRIPWGDIERIRVDSRSRLGLRTELLEIDTGKNLHVLGPSELDAPVTEVVEELRQYRTGR